MSKKTPRQKPGKKAQQTSTPSHPISIAVVGSQTVREILTRTTGLLELIQLACEAATGDDFEATQVFGPDLLHSLPQLYRLAACDLDRVGQCLSHDAAAFHANQLREMAIETPGARLAQGGGR